MIKRATLKLSFYRNVNNFLAPWLVYNRSSLPHEVTSVWLSGRRVCRGNAPGLEANYPKGVCIIHIQRRPPKPSLRCQLPGVTFPRGCSCIPSPLPSLHYFPGCCVLCLQPGTFLQRNSSFSQTICQVVKINLRACRELSTGKCLATSPQPTCRKVLSWLAFIRMSLGYVIWGHWALTALNSKGSYCREGCNLG